MARKKVIILGAGVAGLSTAVCIQSCCPHLELEIVAEHFSPHTTSDGSGGFWEPYATGSDVDRFLQMGEVTFNYLMGLANSPLAGQIGVQLISGYTLDHGESEPSYRHIVDGYRKLTPTELARFPKFQRGYFHTTVQVDVTPYLQWLMEKFRAGGGRTRTAKITSLNQLAGQCDLVVTCCGLGARELLGDELIEPTRGQIWRVDAPWVKHFYIFKEKNGFDISYVLPGKSLVVIGGTAQKGDWNTGLSETDSKGIWTTARQCLPLLAGCTPVKGWAGLRPTRTTLRLERETINIGNTQLQVVHNYGHGGSGITVHWGCALEASRMVMESLSKETIPTANYLEAKL